MHALVSQARSVATAARSARAKSDAVRAAYWSALGSRLIAGREPTWTELYNRAPVGMVSENMARELWKVPSKALGKRIRSLSMDDWREVIGVVADLRDDGIDQKAPSIVYWP